jgi:hypothetical protein
LLRSHKGDSGQKTRGDQDAIPRQDLEGIDPKEGRDHHAFASSPSLAGGGLEGGQVVGKKDDFGMNIIEDKIQIHDLHAPVLYCLGLEHTRLTFGHLAQDFPSHRLAW